ncbi:allantoinase AllB [Paenibacillus turpanensis]|uniref:allantoinase AllB n=1 Tax=Paenibacillus turpanensis TaxID=2689078 RepID=UPI0031331869
MDKWIKGGLVVLRDRTARMDIGIQDGKIAVLTEGEPVRQELPYGKSNGGSVFRSVPAVDGVELDVSGWIVMPGMVDAHVHLNEPGLGHWEGFVSGSSALAAGGCTTYIDMPLNGIPPTVTVQALEQKLALANGASAIDFALWGGLVPGNLDELSALAEAGVAGFKAFMSDPGGEGEGIFRNVDELTLLRGMQLISRTGKVLAIHAEDEVSVRRLAELAIAEGRTKARDFIASRTAEAEAKAVRKAIELAEISGCRLHFVHISSAQSIQLIQNAKARGIDVSAETCPHYLVLTDEDAERVGPAAKCAPPLRSREELEALWTEVLAGNIDWVASDHSPCPTEMKSSENWFEAWGGISGAQHTLELMIDEGVNKRGLPLHRVAAMTSLTPAQRFGLHPRKGEIAVGADADFALIDLKQSYTVSEQTLLQRHKHSPYVGREIGCRVRMTILGGEIVYLAENGICTSGFGKWLRPM